MRHTTCVSVALCTALAATIGLSVRAAAQDPNNELCTSLDWIQWTTGVKCQQDATGAGCTDGPSRYTVYGGGTCLGPGEGNTCWPLVGPFNQIEYEQLDDCQTSFAGLLPAICNDEGYTGIWVEIGQELEPACTDSAYDSFGNWINTSTPPPWRS